MLNFFAHAGHSHEPELPVNYIFPVIFLVLLLGAALFWLAKTNRIKRANALLITAGCLLLLGVIEYKFLPVFSIISLSSGLAITLFVTLAQFMRR